MIVPPQWQVPPSFVHIQLVRGGSHVPRLQKIEMVEAPCTECHTAFVSIGRHQVKTTRDRGESSLHHGRTIQSGDGAVAWVHISEDVLRDGLHQHLVLQ
jgi:hypothetical protein